MKWINSSEDTKYQNGIKEEMENLNKSTILKKSISNKNPGEKKSLGSDGFPGELYWMPKIEPQASINSSKKRKAEQKECFPLYDYEGTMNAENIHGFAQSWILLKLPQLLLFILLVWLLSAGHSLRFISRPLPPALYLYGSLFKGETLHKWVNRLFLNM